MMIAIIRKNTSHESSSLCISTYLNWNTMMSTLLYGKDYRDRRFFFPDALHDYHYEFYIAETFSFVQVFLYIFYVLYIQYNEIQSNTIQYNAIQDVKQNCKRCKEGNKRCSYTKKKVSNYENDVHYIS